MNHIIDVITAANDKLNAFAWGPVMLFLLIGTGVFLSIQTGFLQVRKFPYMLRHTVGSLFRKEKTAHNGNLSPFQAVTTALAGTVGTGNIAGVTGAIFVGGPGAVFWMWVSAFFGMATKYSEIALAVKFRHVEKDGTYKGGPMYYIEKGLGANWRPLALIFSLFGAVACFGIGNISQASEISGVMQALFGVKPQVTGIILSMIVAIVILGGVTRIGQVTAFLVPFMAGFYILAGIGVLLLRISDVPAVFLSILRGAFGLDAVAGGAVGTAIMLAVRQGVSRGVFSNEAGLGSAPMAHAASSSNEPVQQAMWGIFEVFFDTIIICTITAFALLLSGVLDTSGGLSAFASRGSATAAAFNSILPGTLGGIMIQISILFFALSTILGWSYYGAQCWGYLSGNNKAVDALYKIAFICTCTLGAVGSGNFMWQLSDTLNGLMAIPNLIALIFLSGAVAKLTREYFKKH